MNDNAIGWPFVLSRNPWLDWRAIRAPSFLIDACADYELLQAVNTDSSASHPWSPNQSSMSAENLGKLTLVFASTMALTDKGENRTDRFGRAIRVIFGFVLVGDHPDAVSIWSDVLFDLEHIAMLDLMRFWDQDDENWLPMASEAVHLESTTAPMQGLDR